MNRSLLVLGITLAAALPARADLTHKIQSSVQLDVGGASTRAIRVGNSYSISGTGVDTSVTSGGSTTSDALGGLVLQPMASTPSRFQTQPKRLLATHSALQPATPKATPFQRQLQQLVPFQPLAMSPVQLQALTLAWLAPSPQQALSRSRLAEPTQRLSVKSLLS